jgi:alpha-glucosidase
VLLLTLRGQPIIYYGDELGLRETVISPGQVQDPWGIHVSGMGRDGCRTPMPWTAAPGHGFTEPAIEPWLPFGDDAIGRNVEEQLADPSSILNLYRELLRIRDDRPSLHMGTIEFFDDVPDGVLGFVRADGSERTIVLINFSDGERTVTAPEGATLLLSTVHTRTVITPDVLAMAPNEAVVVDPGSGT